MTQFAVSLRFPRVLLSGWSTVRRRRKKEEKERHEKTVCPPAYDSCAYFRLIQTSLSLSLFVDVCLSISLLFYSNLPHFHNSSCIFAQIGPCSDIRVASSSWHMEGPWTPCFPRAIPRGFSRDVPPSWPNWYFTLLSLMRIQSHTPARNIFIRIPSPFTFPLLRYTGRLRAQFRSYFDPEFVQPAILLWRYFRWNSSLLNIAQIGQTKQVSGESHMSNEANFCLLRKCTGTTVM